MQDKPSKFELIKGLAILAVIIALVTIINQLVIKGFWALVLMLLDKFLPPK